MALHVWHFSDLIAPGFSYQVWVVERTMELPFGHAIPWRCMENAYAGMGTSLGRIVG
jgi:hypothetical protein